MNLLSYVYLLTYSHHWHAAELCSQLCCEAESDTSESLGFSGVYNIHCVP